MPDSNAPSGDALQVALNFIGRGWNVVPVPYRSKKPIGGGWDQRVIDAATAPKLFNGERMNVGVRLGPTSHNLTDVDLDCAEAIAIAPYVLRKTGAIFGRPSKRASHYLYRVADLATRSDLPAAVRFKAPDNVCLCELRIGASGGAQTIFPGSVHESGELIDWEPSCDGEPATSDGDDLLARVKLIAAASVIARCWPPGKSNRHEIALAVGGFLARAGMSETNAGVLLEAISRAAGDEEWKDRRTAGRDAVRKLKTGGRVYGLPALVAAIGKPAADKAAEWLDYDEPDLVINDGSEDSPEVPRRRLVATPFVWRDPATIPPRRWVYGWHYIRKFTSATVAPGALGKSSLQLVEAIAIALKLPLLGIMPVEQCNVWYWNGEDPAEETERRIAAICARYNIDGRQLEGRLFTDTGRLTPMKLAALKRGELAFDMELVRDVQDTIRENKISVAIFDPFISVHDVPESDNTNIDAVVKCFGHIADETGISAEFAHHVRKPSSGQSETTVDDARGASALMFAVQSGRVLNRMSREQAAELKIEQPRFYFRTDNGKANLRPPEAAQWWHLATVDLPNGDQVGVVEAWKYPNPLDRITTTHMHQIRTRAAEGSYRKDARADDWIGRAVAEIADLDPDDKADLRTIKAALAAWFANGVLGTEDRQDGTRRPRSFVIPGNWNEGET